MNVLVVGLGSIAQKHIAALRSIDPSARITALRSGARSDAQAIDGITNIHSLEELPEPPDFVLISNPTFLHKETIESVLPLKKPLFIEKPVLLSLDGADVLEELVRAAGIPTYVGCNLRFHPCIGHLREWLQKEKPAIRSVAAVCASRVTDWQPGRDFQKSFRSKLEESGGVHLELIHELDYVTWLFGQPAKSTKTLQHRSDIAMSAYDYAHYDLTYPTFEATITLDYDSPENVRTCAIETDGKPLLADLIGFTIRERGEIVYNPGGSMLDTYEAQMRWFLGHLRTGKPMMNDFSEALATLRLALL